MQGHGPKPIFPSVHPDWYWQLKLLKENYRDPIGFVYFKELDINYTHQNVAVVGEVNYQQNKFFVAHWQPHGYFFISEKDYRFAEKYKKYLLPINYTSQINIYNGSEYAIVAYYLDSSAQYVGDLPVYFFKDQPRSGLNLKVILKMTFRRSLMSIILTDIRYTDLIYQVIQIIGPAGYTNEFIENIYR